MIPASGSVEGDFFKKKPVVPGAVNSTDGNESGIRGSPRFAVLFFVRGMSLLEAERFEHVLTIR